MEELSYLVCVMKVEEIMRNKDKLMLEIKRCEREYRKQIKTDRRKVCDNLKISTQLQEKAHKLHTYGTECELVSRYEQHSSEIERYSKQPFPELSVPQFEFCRKGNLYWLIFHL